MTFEIAMLPAKQIGCCALLLFGLSPAVAARQGVSAFDGPFAFALAPWRHHDRSAANEESAAGREKACGLALRPLLWEPGQTITVCFRSGTRKARARVARIASEWLQYANLKFDFGDVADPHMCNGGSREAIKIDFIKTGPKSGHWSVVGKLSLKTDHSMNLALFGEDELPRHPVSGQPLERVMRRVVLHEFGHALGLHHEHQNPRSGCDAEIKEEAIGAYGARYKWSRKYTREYLMQYPDYRDVIATKVDRKSIMYPTFPAWLLKNGEESPCFVPLTYELSDGDKAFIAQLYPLASRDNQN